MALDAPVTEKVKSLPWQVECLAKACSRTHCR